MIVRDIVQRSDEWHAWRSQGISASEAPAIVGRSPYKTIWRVWAEKTGLIAAKDLSRNPNVIRGVINEGAARAQFEETVDDDEMAEPVDDSVRQEIAQKHGVTLIPVCGESDENPLMRASFDGLTDTGIPVEIKCPAQSTFLDVVMLGRESKAYNIYWCQVQHQIYVAGSSKGYLYFWFEGFDVAFEIQRDDAFLVELVDKSMEFWAHLKNGTEPFKNPDEDIFIPTGECAGLWLALAAEYRQEEEKLSSYREEMKKLESRLDEKERRFLDMMAEFSCGEYAGVRVTRYVAKGSIGYKSVVKALLPDLTDGQMERFRGKPKTGVRVTVRDEERKAEVPFDLQNVKDAMVEDHWI